MMTGGLSESEARQTIWKDVSKVTFEQFAQFAYTGHYSVTEPVLREVSSEDQKKMEEERDIWLINEAPRRYHGGQTQVDAGVWDKTRTHNDHISSNAPSAKHHVRDCLDTTYYDPKYDYTNVLVGHAALYILAELWLVEPLKRLALENLGRMLDGFGISTFKNADILQLLDFIYGDEDGRATMGQNGEGLGNLVCQYLIFHGKRFGEDERFMKFLTRGGQLVRDIWMVQYGDFKVYDGGVHAQQWFW